MINENQEEVVRLCLTARLYDHTHLGSAGLWHFKQRLLRLHSRGACPSCRRMPRGVRRAPGRQKGRYVLMQDKDRDRFKFYTTVLDGEGILNRVGSESRLFPFRRSRALPFLASLRGSSRLANHPIDHYGYQPAGEEPLPALPEIPPPEKTVQRQQKCLSKASTRILNRMLSPIGGDHDLRSILAQGLGSISLQPVHRR